MAAKISSSRIVTAIVLIAFLISVIIVGGYYAIAAACLALLAVTYDATKAVIASGKKPLTAVVYITVAAILPAYLLYELAGVFMLLTASLIVTLCAAVFTKKRNFADIAFTLFLLQYPIIPASTLLFMTCIQDKVLVRICLFMACILPSACDTSAYFIGINFGKRKLCPHISPKKTVEGSIAAFAGGTLVGLITGLIITNFISDRISFMHYLIMGFASGFFSQVGDLTASILKRHGNIKDFGNYLPGHGGALDRMDSIIATSVLVFFYVKLVILR